MTATDTAVEVKDVVEDVVELVEDTANLVEGRVSWLVSNPKGVVLITAIVAGSLGLSAGYLLAGKKLQLKYQRIADEQIEQIKERYSTPRVFPSEEEKPDLEELARRTQERLEVEAERAKARDISTREGYTAYGKVESNGEAPAGDDAVVVTEEKIVATNVFETGQDVGDAFDSDEPDTYFNMAEEEKYRDENPDGPWIITKDEFNNNDTDYNQTRLTYYEEDDVLTDEADTIVPDRVSVIGEDAVDRFGAASRDPKIVYVRNNRLELDIEVVQSDGSYAKEVLGFGESERPASRRFRDTD